MNDVVLFGSGCLVASMCAGAVGVLMYGARWDGAAVVPHAGNRRIAWGAAPLQPAPVRATDR
jgi:hypothetical protein